MAAFDPKSWNTRVYQDKGLTGTQLFQKSFPWDPGVPGPAFDLEKAKSLVTQAKNEGWNGTVRVLFTNSAVDANAAISLEGMLKAAGINAQVDTSKVRRRSRPSSPDRRTSTSPLGHRDRPMTARCGHWRKRSRPAWPATASASRALPSIRR